MMLNCLTEKLRPTARLARDITALVWFIAFAAGSAHAQNVLPNSCNALFNSAKQKLFSVRIFTPVMQTLKD